MRDNDTIINYLVGIITGDSDKRTKYMSGPELVDFFNQFGFKDVYTYGGKSFSNGATSRANYCKGKLQMLSEQENLGKIIMHYYHPEKFIGREDVHEELIAELNKWLYFHDLALVNKGKYVKLVKSNALPKKADDHVFSGKSVSIILRSEIFDPVRGLLNSGHYAHAVEESYKIVRKKLKEKTGEEQAHKAFGKDNMEGIFGHLPEDDAESDFFKGVQFLHMAIQYLRNEKAHTPASKLDKNRALHYIALASLAYDLLSEND